MPPPIAKSLKTTYQGDMYMCFLTEDDRPEITTVHYGDRHVGEIIPFEELPWPVRAMFESEMDPHQRGH